MVNPVNGAGSQQSVSILNPFDQKADQQNRVKSDDGQSKNAGTAGDLFKTGNAQSPKTTSLAQAQSATGQDNEKPKTQGRGSLINITA